MKVMRWAIAIVVWVAVTAMGVMFFGSMANMVWSDLHPTGFMLINTIQEMQLWPPLEWLGLGLEWVIFVCLCVCVVGVILLAFVLAYGAWESSGKTEVPK